MKERWFLTYIGKEEKSDIRISRTCLYVTNKEQGETLYCIVVDDLSSTADSSRVLHLIKGVSNWHALGSQLGLSTSKLDEIQLMSSDSVEQKKILVEILFPVNHKIFATHEIDPKPSWEKIHQALQAVDEIKVAGKIKPLNIKDAVGT